MSAEAKVLTSTQDAFARQLTREGKQRRLPGDGLRSIATNAAIGLGATTIDVGQGVVFEKIMGKVFHKRNEALRATLPLTVPDDVKDKVVTRESAAVDFVAEWGTDIAITTLGNAVASTLTGSDEKYVSETSAFLADWANTLIQVFTENKAAFKIVDVGIRSRDLVDAVNLEAGFRILAELPGGGAVDWLLDKTNHWLEHSNFVKLTNNAAAKAILGYHIQNSHNNALLKVMPPSAAT